MDTAKKPTIRAPHWKRWLRRLAWFTCVTTLLLVGFASGDIPKLAGHLLLLKRAAAKGVYWDHDFDGAMIERATDELIRMLVAGEINPVVNDGYGYDDLPKALAELGTRGSVGKLVLRMRP